jgi:hypothetical protein
MIQVNAHYRVADLCVAMAETVYEECAGQYNGWYKKHPDRAKFVKQCAPTLRAHARQVMAEMLGRRDIPDDQKADIYEALMLDGTLPQGGPIEVSPAGNLF